MNTHLSLSSTVTLTPRRAGLRTGQDNEFEVLVGIQAPDAPAGHLAERPPQALALVIDRSGSMSGRPISAARRCAEYVVGRLRATDAVALVQFDHRVQRLWPAVRLGNGEALRSAIDGIHAAGNTNLHGGWLEGVQALSEVSGSGLKRVVLLSDGRANSGLLDTASIANQCAEWAAQGITTSTYGLGNGFNEELMVAMARAGGGNHYYGDSAEDLMDPFQQELDLLGNLCMRDLRLSVTTPEGVEATMANALPAAEAGWRLPDLAWGAQAWVVLRLKLPVSALRTVGMLMPLLKVSVEGKSLGGESVQLERAGLALPVMTSAAFDALCDDERVTRRLIELAAADALGRMRAAAGAGDWDAVDRLLQEASRQFAGNEWVGAILDAMRSLAESRLHERMMKESIYASSKLRNRLLAQGDEGPISADAAAVDVPSYLRRKPSQGKADA
jgi:Ca-activated chloride channel family protein